MIRISFSRISLIIFLCKNCQKQTINSLKSVSISCLIIHRQTMKRFQKLSNYLFIRVFLEMGWEKYTCKLCTAIGLVIWLPSACTLPSFYLTNRCKFWSVRLSPICKTWQRRQGFEPGPLNLWSFEYRMSYLTLAWKPASSP